MARAVIMLTLPLAALAFACGQGGDSTSLPRQIDIEELSFEELRLQAVAALSRSGQVYHTTQLAKGSGIASTTEVWLDMEEDVARVLEGEQRLRIFHGGKIAELGPNGRFQDADIWAVPGLTKSAALSLEYITVFFGTNIETTRIEPAVLEDVAAILVEVIDPYHGDYSGIQKHRIYLDESFLPMRIDYHADISGAPDLDWSMAVQNEFIDPSGLPEGFFSPEAVREHEVTPADDIARAAEVGLRPYWLGEQFEEMVLQDAMLMAVEDAELYEEGVEPWLVLRYGRSQEEGMGVTWASIHENTESEWQRKRSTWKQPPWWEGPGAVSTTFVMLGVEATLYQGPPYDFMPGVTKSDWIVLAHVNDMVLEIVPGGPPESSPYMEKEALLRLAQSMRPFERPA